MALRPRAARDRSPTRATWARQPAGLLTLACGWRWLAGAELLLEPAAEAGDCELNLTARRGA